MVSHPVIQGVLILSDSTSGNASSHYLPTLDGWRAIAIFIVLLNHDSVHRIGPFSTSWFHHHGRTGVDLFFALSGLLICSRLLTEEQSYGAIDLQKFYLRRLFRIQPAAWAYLLTICLLMLNAVLRPAWDGVITAFVLVRNYIPTRFGATEWYTAHFWSLAVEEHFYLFLPGFLRVFTAGRARLLFGIAGILIGWSLLIRRQQFLSFGWAPEYHTETAVIGILLAAGMAILLSRGGIRDLCYRFDSPYIALAMTLVLLVVQSRGDYMLIDVLLLCVYPLLIVSTMLHPDSFAGRLLSLSPLRKLGTFSYSIYLWQMLFFHPANNGDPQISGVLAVVQHSTPLRYAMTLTLSIVSYYAVEQPMIRLGRKLTRKPSVVEMLLS